MRKCVMTFSAVEAIRAASLPASVVMKETGGILIGPPPADELVMITSATGPGPDDKCASAASWETEPGYLNEELRIARDEDPAVDLRGFWHLHPGKMNHPSMQDLSEARGILEDVEHYRLGGELVMPIVTGMNGHVTITCYYISSHDPQFREIPIEVVPDADADEMVKALLSAEETVELETESHFGFWQDGGWQFYTSSYGATRLEAELDELKRAGYEVTARLVDDGICCVEVRREDGGEATLFLLPREFPLNPPRIFMKSDGDIRELEVGTSSLLRRWSSGFRLSELIPGGPGERLPGDSYTRSSLSGILADIREDFRHGRCDVFNILRQLAGALRPAGGRERCDS